MRTFMVAIMLELRNKPNNFLTHSEDTYLPVIYSLLNLFTQNTHASIFWLLLIIRALSKAMFPT